MKRVFEGKVWIDPEDQCINIENLGKEPPYQELSQLFKELDGYYVRVTIEDLESLLEAPEGD